MYESYGLYLAFFLISTIIFTIMGIILRFYTGRDYYKIITRIAVIVIFIFLWIWAFTVENETTEQMVGNYERNKNSGR